VGQSAAMIHDHLPTFLPASIKPCPHWRL